jgi:hypothetical protein
MILYLCNAYKFQSVGKRYMPVEEHSPGILIQMRLSWKYSGGAFFS